MPATSPGHLFILRGDLTRLACDAWLLPTNANLVVEQPWRNVLLEHARLPTPYQANESLLIRPAGIGPWHPEHGRILRLRDWPSHEPEPWLTNVGGGENKPPSWYAEGVTQFLRAVRATDPTSRYRRERALVALPVVGTGKGGGAAQAGDIVQALLPILDTEGRQKGLDVALVAYGAQHFAAAQEARRRYSSIDWWSELDPQRRALTKKLAITASAGGLALFLGAGVSYNAGLPTWNELLRALATRRNMSEAEIARLEQLDHLEQAAVLERKYRHPDRLREAIVNECDGKHWHSLTQGLLASLPVREAVTTNYDCLFESAWQGALAERGNQTARPLILPYERPEENGRWLLKMHGCLQHPEDIVLTRDSFLGYNERRAALAGLVQGLMLTRHLLFVGFSLQDYNFHRIAHAVRQVLPMATPGERNRRFGTALMLFSGTLLQELWADELVTVAMDDREEIDLPRSEKGAAFRASSRKLEIFLDLVLANTSDDSHLLDPRFACLLDEADRKLADQLRQLLESSEPGKVRARLGELLERLGHNPRGQQRRSSLPPG